MHHVVVKCVDIVQTRSSKVEQSDDGVQKLTFNM